MSSIMIQQMCRRIPIAVCVVCWLCSPLAKSLAAEELHGRPALSDTDYAKHIEKLQHTLPNGFSYTIQKPFVVIGDESAALVRLRSTNTVKWAVDRLKKDFFTRDPEEIIDVWLFQTRESYE